jgi:hypothetical protein
MELIQHLRIGSPLIWVNTVEPERVTEIICSTSVNEVYHLDPFEGLSVWRDNSWKTVLIEMGSAEEGDLKEVPTNNLAKVVLSITSTKIESKPTLSELSKLIGTLLPAEKEL